jgi:diacylglycerol kinase family enzyme
MDPPIAVILNTHSGDRGGVSPGQTLEALFRANGRSVKISLAKEQGLKQLAEQSVRGESDLIVAAGGDGTIACVAAALVGTSKTLGVLPLGSLNHFSKDLGIPQELGEAVRTVVTGHSIQVDVGEVNGRIFVNNSCLGVYPLMVSDREAQQHRLGRGKWLAFVWATLRVLRRYPLLEMRIMVAGKNLSRRTPFLFVGNNAYALAGSDLGGRRTLQAGNLGLYVTRDTGRFGLFRLLGRAICGRLNQTTDFDALCVEEAWIETPQRHLLVATDGEVTPMASPLHFRTRPGALRVRVPRPTGPS